MTRVIDQPVLVLNRGWEPVGVFDVATAITTVIRDMAWALHQETYELLDFERWCETPTEGAPLIRTPSGGVPAPEIIVLREYSVIPRRSTAFSRRGLYRRDDYRCQFCGCEVPAGERTIDHVLPRSRGGPTSWENCVLSCAACNSRKADRLPHEAGMQLLARPVRPSWAPSLRVQQRHVLPSWKTFLKGGHVEVAD